MPKFSLTVYLLQPRTTGGRPAAWKARGRWVGARPSGASSTVTDGALTDRRVRTLDVHRAPDQIGTTWQVDVEDVRYGIEDVRGVSGRLAVTRLSLSTTDTTGETAT